MKQSPVAQPVNQVRLTVDLLAGVCTHRGCELGGNLLRLVADIEFRDLSALFIIWWEHACQHPDEGGLTSAILPQHHQDLTVGEGSFLNIQPEAALSHHAAAFQLLAVGGLSKKPSGRQAKSTIRYRSQIKRARSQQ